MTVVANNAEMAYMSGSSTGVPTTEPSYWLVDQAASGTRLRLDAGGLLIGRSPSCHIVLTDPHISRHHALVRLGSHGPEVVRMGRQSIHVKRRTPISAGIESESVAMTLKTGDGIDICGRRFVIAASLEREQAHEDNDAGSRWVIECGQDALYRITHTPFSIGGSPGDDLVIDAWPAHALYFRLTQGALTIEVCAAIDLNQRSMTPGEVAVVDTGDTLEMHGERVTILAIPRNNQRTTLIDRKKVPDELQAVQLHRLPNGEGRLALTFGEHTQAICMSALRAELIHCLLDPPAPYRAGSIIPDEVACGQIWPHSHNKDRTDLNTLSFRVRRSLVKAGINGVELLQRVGGGTRFHLPTGCTIEICHGRQGKTS